MAKIDVTKTELVWPGKYNEDGSLREVPRVNLPFQVIERVNESRAAREALKSGKQLDMLFEAYAGKEGDTFEDGWRNKLIWGDNLLVMSSLLTKFAGKFDLIYIDPPFATGADFSFYARIGDEDEPLLKESSILEEKAYRDTWGRGIASYIEMMHSRLRCIRELLSDAGTLVVQCDWQVNSYLRVALDEIFGAENFVNEVVWKRSDAKGDSGQGARHFGRIQDTIFFYRKSEAAYWKTLYRPLDESYIKNFYKHKDSDGRLYKLENMLGPGGAAKGNPVYEVKGVTRAWRYSRERMKELISKGLVIQTKPGTVPMQKKYLEDSKGYQVGTWWDDISMILNPAIDSWPTE